MEHLTRFLGEQGLHFYAPLPFDKAEVFSDKLSRMQLSFEVRSVWFLLVPYFSGFGKNISAYAVARDYHFWAKSFFEALHPVLKKAIPDATFAFCCDNSPVNERKGAMAASLGTLGDNGLLLHPLYGSFFFICEVLSDAPVSAFPTSVPESKAKCSHCGACVRACPTKALSGEGECLSAITQKKGSLTDQEKAVILEHGCAWGCDLCQIACPINRNALQKQTIFSPIPFFSAETIPFLTSGLIENMPEEEFKSRAYAWRKKETVLRNLRLLENCKGMIGDEK